MPNQAYRPPFEITPTSVTMAAEIERLIGRYEGFGGLNPSPTLRRQNEIRTIVGSLAIPMGTAGLDASGNM